MKDAKDAWNTYLHSSFWWRPNVQVDIGGNRILHNDLYPAADNALGADDDLAPGEILHHHGDIGRLAAVQLDLEQRVVRLGQVDVDAAPAEVAVADPDIFGLPLSLPAEEMESCVK